MTRSLVTARNIVAARLCLPSATKLQQGNVFTPVCHFVHKGVSGRHLPFTPGRHSLGRPPGRHPQAESLGRHPLARHPREDPPSRHHGQAPRETPWADTLLGRHPPWADTPWQMATAVDGMHPTGMHTCFTGVCDSVQGERVSAWGVWPGTPPGRHPPADLPPPPNAPSLEQTPLWADYPMGRLPHGQKTHPE